jgi:hypothetical protein
LTAPGARTRQGGEHQEARMSHLIEAFIDAVLTLLSSFHDAKGRARQKVSRHLRGTPTANAIESLPRIGSRPRPADTSKPE